MKPILNDKILKICKVSNLNFYLEEGWIPSATLNWNGWKVLWMEISTANFIHKLFRPNHAGAAAKNTTMGLWQEWNLRPCDSCMHVHLTNIKHFPCWYTVISTRVEIGKTRIACFSYCSYLTHAKSTNDQNTLQGLSKEGLTIRRITKNVSWSIDLLGPENGCQWEFEPTISWCNTLILDICGDFTGK
jgi:hypothetical protein